MFLCFTTVTTASLDTTFNCTWIQFNVGEIIECPPGFIIIGICDSLVTANCSGFASEAKCCQLDGYVVDNNSCVKKGLSPGQTGDCYAQANNFNSHLVRSCTSFNETACEGETGVANATAVTVSIY